MIRATDLSTKMLRERSISSVSQLTRCNPLRKLDRMPGRSVLRKRPFCNAPKLG